MLSNDSLIFLDDLKKNNNKEWFLTNRKRYDTFKEDYLELTSKILEIMKSLDSSLKMLEVKNCTFRINRDIRFSKDKSPYKSYAGIWLSSAAKEKNRAGYYIHIERDNSFIAGGLYHPNTDDLKKIRNEIAFFYDDLTTIINHPNYKREFGDLKREFGNIDCKSNTLLKSAPRGYDKNHLAIDFLKLKSFESIQKIDISEVLKEYFVASICEKLIILKPLNDFINRALASDKD